MDWSETVLKTIPDDHVKAVVGMMYTSIKYEKLMNARLKEHNLSQEQFSVLKILEVVHPSCYSLKEIQARLINQTANTTRLVEKLRQKKLIACVQNPNNRRQLNISITTEGLKTAAKAELALEPITKQLKGVITKDEAAVLTQLFKKIQKIF